MFWPPYGEGGGDKKTKSLASNEKVLARRKLMDLSY